MMPKPVSFNPPQTTTEHRLRCGLLLQILLGVQIEHLLVSIYSIDIFIKTAYTKGEGRSLAEKDGQNIFHSYVLLPWMTGCASVEYHPFVRPVLSFDNAGFFI